jgi:hypothetical protein
MKIKSERSIVIQCPILVINSDWKDLW